jgi:hypothetical protein
MLTLVLVGLAGVIVIGVAWEALTLYLDYDQKARDEHDCAVNRCTVARIDAEKPS